MLKFCKSLTTFSPRETTPVSIGKITIGGSNPIAVQSMTNTDTNDTQSSVNQILKIREATGDIVRLTAQGDREAENLKNIVAELDKKNAHDIAIVADIHFKTSAAAIAAKYVDKVRVNPGNYADPDKNFRELIALCKSRNVAIRIGVNHGSLSQSMTDKYGDTTEGMVASAMEFLRICKEEDFSQVVVSMKSSNVRVMVQAYRMLVVAMQAEDMHFPLHLGVTEAGDGAEARIKSAAGVGALLIDGIGDTIRVSLTENPENEIPVGRAIVNYLTAARKEQITDIIDESIYSPLEYKKENYGIKIPLIYSELSSENNMLIIEAKGDNPTAFWRAEILNLRARGERRPIMIKREYLDTDLETMQIKAAADMGLIFLDALSDGIWIEAPQFSAEQVDFTALAILQATRVRMSRTEYIACPSCGRTQYNLQESLQKIKARTSHLKGLKIGVMGCIVNGPGEMADADYGYVGSGKGKITLYKKKEVIQRNIPEQDAIEALVELIKENGDWHEPK